MRAWWNRDPDKPCRSAREFGDEFRSEVKALGGHGWKWNPDMRDWLAGVFMGCRFGHPDFDWSPNAARALAKDFLSEASTW